MLCALVANPPWARALMLRDHRISTLLGQQQIYVAPSPLSGRNSRLMDGVRESDCWIWIGHDRSEPSIRVRTLPTIGHLAAPFDSSQPAYCFRRLKVTK